MHNSEQRHVFMFSNCWVEIYVLLLRLAGVQSLTNVHLSHLHTDHLFSITGDFLVLFLIGIFLLFIYNIFCH